MKKLNIKSQRRFIYKNIKTGEYYGKNCNPTKNINEAEIVASLIFLVGTPLVDFQRIDFDEELKTIRKQKLIKINE